jgi:hypothetical protein
VEGGVSNATFWFGVVLLVLVVVGGSGIVFWARRAAKAPDPGPEPGFTLADIRAMLERGEITQREFDTARDAMVHRTRETARRERQQRGGTDWGDAGERGRSGRR